MTSNKDRFIRWQGVLREHVTFLNNLLLTISIGIIGFQVSLVTNLDFNPKCGQKVFFTFGFLLLFLSIFFGVGTAFSRLFDFRATLKKIKADMHNTGKSEELFTNIKLFERITWLLFYSQMATLIIGFSNVAIAILWIYKNKFF